MLDCGSPPESAGHTSHEPERKKQNDSEKKNAQAAAEQSCLAFKESGVKILCM